MKKLECLIEVPDKYTKEIYKVGNVYEFTDERAKEVLAARTKVTNEPYFVEWNEEGWVVQQEDDGNVHIRPVIDGKVADTPVERVTSYKEEKPKKKTRKSTKK